jgi:exopolyphosphatase / guanosine-5'-triphosphate,3'-diphosphate pyrophosphatase
MRSEIYMSRLASIDIGTQTIRLLVADTDKTGKIISVYRDRAIVRLGEGMIDNHHLQNDPMNRALLCIKDFANSAGQHGAEHIYAVATACVREAVNGRAFLDIILRETGLSVRLVSGEEEAILSCRGVLSVFNNLYNQALIVDIGGGSTELILSSNQSVNGTESIPLGVVSLSEQFLLQDPPLDAELNALNHAIRSTFLTKSALVNTLRNDNMRNVLLIGTAGTVTTLAAMDLKLIDYDIDKVNKYILLFNRLKYHYNNLISIPSVERAELPGLEPGREIVIISGIAVLLTLLDLLGAQELSVSDAGLLEGILLEKAG